MSSSVLYPSFRDAQQLYTQYSTLENISILSNHLSTVIDSSFLATKTEENIHAIYNDIIQKTLILLVQMDIK